MLAGGVVLNPKVFALNESPSEKEGKLALPPVRIICYDPQ